MPQSPEESNSAFAKLCIVDLAGSERGSRTNNNVSSRKKNLFSFCLFYFSYCFSCFCFFLKKIFLYIIVKHTKHFIISKSFIYKNNLFIIITNLNKKLTFFFSWKNRGKEFEKLEESTNPLQHWHIVCKLYDTTKISQFQGIELFLIEMQKLQEFSKNFSKFQPILIIQDRVLLWWLTLTLSKPIYL